MSVIKLSVKLQKAEQVYDAEQKKNMLAEIVKYPLDKYNDENMKAKEGAILQLSYILFANKEANNLADLIIETRPFLLHVSKAKAGKLVRHLVDLFLDLEAGTSREVTLCEECISWAESEKRVFLRQALQVRLMTVYYNLDRLTDALKLGTELLKELKKLDDKALLVEVQLWESKVYYNLSNLQKARAALTSARTTANGIYCPPKLQAGLDLQSGILHAADDRDFKTAYSYFFEAFEAYDSINSNKAVSALKYMLMAKIMLNAAHEVPSILSNKLTTKYNEKVIFLRKVALAATERSLVDYLNLTKEFSNEVVNDIVLKSHLDAFYDTLLMQNLSKIVEPYNKIQLEYIATKINLPLATVEKKLSQMILDKSLNGIIDQGSNVLVIFDDVVRNESYKLSLDAIHALGDVVDQLYHKGQKLC